MAIFDILARVYLVLYVVVNVVVYFTGYESPRHQPGNNMARRRLVGFPRIGRRASARAGPSEANNDSKRDGDAASEAQPVDKFEPRPEDVFEVKKILRPFLPIELVDSVLEFAEYWVCDGVDMVVSSPLSRSRPIIGGSGSHENQLLLRTRPVGLYDWPHSHTDPAWQAPAAPLPLKTEYAHDVLKQYTGCERVLEHPCRKIVFDLYSHDQGWGGDDRADQGTFRSSWTWFSAGLDRFDATAAEGKESARLKEGPELSPGALRPVWPRVADAAASEEDGTVGGSGYVHELLPDAEHKVQCNRLATRPVQHHHVEWRWNDDVEPVPADAPEEERARADALEAAGRGRATGNGEFVRNLKLGDMVTLWGHARFTGWANHVESVQIKVYTAV